jgi:L-fuculose-phosphate aldolase
MNAAVTLPELEREVVRVSRAVHGRGWVANHEGNVTALTADGRILATSAAISLGDVREADLLVLDRQGRKLSGSRDPFPEISMHVAVYQGRPDVGAVVHAHPARATAFAIAGRPLEALFLPEFVVSLGGVVPLVPFALPGSEALARNLEPFLEEFDAVLLQNHGVLAWGPDPATALLRLEHVELTAAILREACPFGGGKPIPEELVRLLLDARSRAGLGPAGRARARGKARAR